MVNTKQTLSVTIDGDDYYDIRDQAKAYFSLDEIPAPQPVVQQYPVYKIGKLQLVKFLRQNSSLSLMECKRAVEEEFGEPL
jgi:hypothetical protein